MKPRRNGFTLVEVLVALSIVAVALAAGLKAAGALTNNAQRQQDISVAQWCADNQLVNLKLGRVFPGIGTVESSCTELGRTLGLKTTTQGTPNPGFRKVDVQVFDEAGLPLLTVSTVLPRT